jgi:hypothetical protein
VGTNKRYADRIDSRAIEKARLGSRDGLSRPAYPDWTPPWPAIRIGEAEWVVMREAKDEPRAVIRAVTLGPLSEVYFRVVTWAPTSEGRTLIGYFESLEMADRAVLFAPPRANPDPRTSTGHGGNSSIPSPR